MFDVTYDSLPKNQEIGISETEGVAISAGVVVCVSVDVLEN